MTTPTTTTRPMMDVNAAIALLQAKHKRELEALAAKIAATPIVTRNGAYVPRAKKGEAKTAKATVHKAGPAIFGLTLPPKGSLTAEQFLKDGDPTTGIKGLRNAGKRPFKGINMRGEEIHIIKVDPSKVDHDIVCAISAYIGYNTTGNRGAQQQVAEMQARRETNPAKGFGRAPNGHIPSRTEDRAKAQAGIAHSPPGVNDHNAKRLSELKGIEQSIVEELIPAERMVENSLHLLYPNGGESINPELSPDEQMEVTQLYEDHLGELSVLKARLVQVQEDIRTQAKTEATFQK